MHLFIGVSVIILEIRMFVYRTCRVHLETVYTIIHKVLQMIHPVLLPGKRLPHQTYFPSEWRLKTTKRTKQRRFTGTVQSQQTSHLARNELQVQILMAHFPLTAFQQVTDTKSFCFYCSYFCHRSVKVLDVFPVHNYINDDRRTEHRSHGIQRQYVMRTRQYHQQITKQRDARTGQQRYRNQHLMIG